MALPVTKLLLEKDQNGNVTYGVPFSNTTEAVTLAAAPATESVVVPVGANQAFFQYSVGTNVTVGLAPVAIPGGSFGPTPGQLNPIVRPVTEGNTLHFICDTPAFVYVSFYNDGIRSS